MKLNFAVLIAALPIVSSEIPFSLRRLKSQRRSDARVEKSASGEEMTDPKTEVKDSSDETMSSADDSEPESPLSARKISDLTSEVTTLFNSEDIAQMLPYRYPFLLVDKVVRYEEDKSVVGIKTVTVNEPHFTGHFPGRPVMPGVLQVEALAQLAEIMFQLDALETSVPLLFTGFDAVKWKKPVVPGDTLVMEVELESWDEESRIAKASGVAYVDGQIAVEVGKMKFLLETEL